MARVVVITGAAGALGSACARHLVSWHGYRAALVDVPAAASQLQSVVAEIGDSARAFTANGEKPASWDEILPRITSSLGAPSAAVLIAGGWQGGKPLAARENDAIYKSMLESNLSTAYHALRALVPGMVAQKSGSVVVVGSRAAVQPWTSTGACEYAAAKAGVVALAQAVAAEVLHERVRINAILPSTLDTPANRRAMPSADSSRWVTTESCMRVIAFLLSDESRDVTGAALPIYGRA